MHHIQTKNNKPVHHCGLCNITCGNVINYNHHVNGRKHIIKMGHFQQKSQSASNPREAESGKPHHESWIENKGNFHKGIKGPSQHSQDVQKPVQSMRPYSPQQWSSQDWHASQRHRNNRFPPWKVPQGQKSNNPRHLHGWRSETRGGYEQNRHGYVHPSQIHSPSQRHYQGHSISKQIRKSRWGPPHENQQRRDTCLRQVSTHSGDTTHHNPRNMCPSPSWDGPEFSFPPQPYWNNSVQDDVRNISISSPHGSYTDRWGNQKPNTNGIHHSSMSDKFGTGTEHKNPMVAGGGIGATTVVGDKKDGSDGDLTSSREDNLKLSLKASKIIDDILGKSDMAADGNRVTPNENSANITSTVPLMKHCSAKQPDTKTSNGTLSKKTYEEKNSKECTTTSKHLVEGSRMKSSASSVNQLKSSSNRASSRTHPSGVLSSRSSNIRPNPNKTSTTATSSRRQKPSLQSKNETSQNLDGTCSKKPLPGKPPAVSPAITAGNIVKSPVRVNSTISKHLPLVPSAKAKTASKKESLLKLIDQPRSRKERLKIESIIQTHAKVQKQRPRLDLENQDQGEHVTNIDDLPPEVQKQLEQLISADVSGEVEEREIFEQLREEVITESGGLGKMFEQTTENSGRLINEQDGEGNVNIKEDSRTSSPTDLIFAKDYEQNQSVRLDYEEEEEIDLLKLMDSDEEDEVLFCNERPETQIIPSGINVSESPSDPILMQNNQTDVEHENLAKEPAEKQLKTTSENSHTEVNQIESCPQIIENSDNSGSRDVQKESLSKTDLELSPSQENIASGSHVNGESLAERKSVESPADKNSAGNSTTCDKSSSDISVEISQPSSTKNKPEHQGTPEVVVSSADLTTEKNSEDQLTTDHATPVATVGIEPCMSSSPQLTTPCKSPNKKSGKARAKKRREISTSSGDTCPSSTEKEMTSRPKRSKVDKNSNQTSNNTALENIEEPGKEDLVDQVLKISLREEEIHRQLGDTMSAIEHLHALLAQTHGQLQLRLHQREQLLREEVDLRRRRMDILKGAVAERKTQTPVPLVQSPTESARASPGITNTEVNNNFTNALATLRELLARPVNLSPDNINPLSSEPCGADSSTHKEPEIQDTDRSLPLVKEEVPLPDTTTALTGEEQSLCPQIKTEPGCGDRSVATSVVPCDSNELEKNNAKENPGVAGNKALIIPDNMPPIQALVEGDMDIGQDGSSPSNVTMHYMGTLELDETGDSEGTSLLQQLAVNMASLKSAPYMFMEEATLLEASSLSESDMAADASPLQRSNRTRTVSEASQDSEFKSPVDVKLKKPKKSKKLKNVDLEEESQDSESDVNSSFDGKPLEIKISSEEEPKTPLSRSKRKSRLVAKEDKNKESDACTSTRARRKISDPSVQSPESPKKKKRMSRKERDEKRTPSIGNLNDSLVDEEQEDIISTTSKKGKNKKKRDKVVKVESLSETENVCVEEVHSSTDVVVNRKKRTKKSAGVCGIPDEANENEISSATKTKQRLKLDGKKVKSLRTAWTKSKTVSVATSVSEEKQVSDSGASSGNFVGHSGTVYKMIVYEDWLVTCSEDCTVKAFNLKTHMVERTFSQHEKGVHCMVVTSAGSLCTRLFTGSFDATVVSHDFMTGKVLNRFRFEYRVHCCAEAWNKLYVGLGNGDMVVYDLKKNKKITTYNCGRIALRCIASAREGTRKLLCVADVDGGLTIRDASSNLLLRHMVGHVRSPMALQVVDNLVFSGSADKSVQIHNLYNGEPEHHIKHKGVVSSVCVVDDLLFTAGYEGLVRSFSREGYTLEQQYYGANCEMITSMVVHQDMLYTATREGHIEAVVLDRNTRWQCQFGRCKAVFGLRRHLESHVLQDHVTTNPSALKCMWSGCHIFIPSRFKAREAKKHFAIHLDELWNKMKHECEHQSDNQDSDSSSCTGSA